MYVCIDGKTHFIYTGRKLKYLKTRI